MIKSFYTKCAIGLLVVCGSTHVADAASISKPVSSLGLIGYWSFDAGTSTRLHDLSGNGNHGTIQNMDANTDWVSGKFNKALDFDGVNDYVSIPLASDTNTSITESLWFYPRELPSEMAVPYMDLIDKDGDTWDIFLYNCGVGCGGMMVKLVFADTTSQPRVQVSDQYINKNQWNHVVVTYDGTTTNLYLNGVLRSTVTPSLALLDTGNNIYLGTNNGGGAYLFNGKIDDLRIYSRAVSATEAIALYRQGQATRKSVSNSGLVGHWTFNEGTSTIAHDFSGNGFTGTLTNGPTWAHGKKGKSINFDGSNDTVTIPYNIGLDPASQITISAWVKPSAGMLNNYKEVWRKEAGGRHLLSFQESGGCNAGAGTAGCISFGLHIGGVYAELDVPINTQDYADQWVLLTAVYDGSQKRIYRNGSLIGSANTSGSLTQASASFFIGSHGGASEFFQGLIDDVRIYNRGLSQTEVEELYRMNETKINASQDTKMTSGLIGMWSFNGKDMNWNANLAYDRSGNNNNGTLINMSTSTSPVPGKVGQALIFNGSNTLVSVPYNAALTPTNEVSFGAWVKWNSLSGGQRILSKTQSGGYQLSLNEDNVCTASTYCALVYVGGAYHQVNYATSNLSANRWYHTFATYDGETLKLYLNGVEIASNTTPSGAVQYTSSNDLCIGSEPSPTTCVDGAHFNGTIDEARVYNRGLSASEVKQLYLLGK